MKMLHLSTFFNMRSLDDRIYKGKWKQKKMDCLHIIPTAHVSVHKKNRQTCNAQF